jgi:hypothetical protein
MAQRGRPVGTGKLPEEKYILKTFRFPPALWNQFSSVVPKSEWSATIRKFMEAEIKKRRTK